jgi:hypothetical protein
MTSREEYRSKILENIESIIDGLDTLEKQIAETRQHIAMNDAFFLHHRVNLLQDRDYGSIEDLVDLYLDTCQVLGHIEKAQVQSCHACRNLHYYNYKSCSIFEETDKWLGKYL